MSVCGECVWGECMCTCVYVSICDVCVCEWVVVGVFVYVDFIAWFCKFLRTWLMMTTLSPWGIQPHQVAQ